MSAAGNASGSRSRRSAMYCAVHSPTPQISRRRLTETSRSLPASNSVGSASAAEATADSARAAARHAQRRQVGGRDGGRLREYMRQAVLRPRQRRAMRRHQLAAQADRGDHGDLLAQHGAHRQFEAIPGAGDAQAGPGRRQRRQHRVMRQLRRDGGRIAVQVELPPQAGDDHGQGWQPGKRTVASSASPLPGSTATVPCAPSRLMLRV